MRSLTVSGAVLCALLLALAAAAPAGAVLSYNLSSDLKKSGCSGDADGDCLDDSIETGLAWAISPWYFYDEDEGCSGWENDFGQSSAHFARRDYVQIRPHDRDIRYDTSKLRRLLGPIETAKRPDAIAVTRGWLRERGDG